MGLPVKNITKSLVQINRYKVPSINSLFTYNIHLKFNEQWSYLRLLSYWCLFTSLTLVNYIQTVHLNYKTWVQSKTIFKRKIFFWLKKWSLKGNGNSLRLSILKLYFLLHPITPFSIMCKKAMCRGPFSCRLSIVELLSLSWGLRPEQHKDTFLEMSSGQFSFSNPPNHAKMQYIVVLIFFIVHMWSSKVEEQ